jgi:hypothetical protein
MKKHLLLLMIFAVSARLEANIRSCVCTGNWGNSTTWSGGLVPTCSDTIEICSNHTCTINTQQNYSGCPNPMYVYIYGQLTFTTGNKLSLPPGSKVTIGSGACVTPAGGGGSANLITIGSTDVWGTRTGPLCGYIVLSDNAPLPIELITFEATAKKGIVELNWTTASETNNDYFTVEKTADGNHFEVVNKINGGGTSSSVLGYKTEDKTPYYGLSYYRLKQTDFNGDFTVSKLIDVNTKEDSDFSFELFNNPGDGSKLLINIISQTEKEAKLVIIDSNGKNIYSKNFVVTERGKNVNDFYLPQKLMPGIYMIGLTYNERSFCKKFVVQ